MIEVDNNVLVGIAALLILASIPPQLIQVAKRLHDLNMNGWMAFILCVPVVNIVFGLYILFKDGTPGPNEYGEDPKGRKAAYEPN